MRSATLKKIGILLLLGFLVPPLHAQVSYDTVTATVTDPNSNPLANAAYSITLVNAVGNPVSSAVTPNGQIFNAQPVRGNLNASGALSVGLVPNTILTKPAGTQWKIVIGPPQDSAILVYQPSWSITYTVSITAPVDLSSQLSALSQPISFVNLRTNQSTIQGSGGSGCNPSAAQFQFLYYNSPSSPCPGAQVTTDSTHQNLLAPGFVSAATGLYDGSNGFAVMSGSNPAGYTAGSPPVTYTDPCSQMVGISAADDLMPKLGVHYALNVAPSATPVNCGPFGFLDPFLTTPTTNIPQLTAGTLDLPPGVRFGIQSEFDIPMQFLVRGNAPLNGNNSTGSVIQPSTAIFTMNPFINGHDTAVENLGPNLTNTGPVFSLGSQAANHTVSCNSIPGLIGNSNAYGQQESAFYNMTVINCMWPVVFHSRGTGGGSQNNFGGVGYTISPIDGPNFPVMTGISLASAGTGYTKDFALIVSGCTVAPTLNAQTSGGAVTGLVYPSGPNLGVNAFGDCPNPAGVSVSFANGAGTGASGTAIIQGLATPGGISFLGAGAPVSQSGVVSSATISVPPPECYDVEGVGVSLLRDYCETALVGVAIGSSSSNQITSMYIGDFGFQPHSLGYSMVTVSNHAPAYTIVNSSSSGGTVNDLDDRSVNGGTVPHQAQVNGGGDAGTLSLVSRNASGFYLSNDPHIVTNVPMGYSAPNCGSSCTGLSPAAGFLAKTVGGDFQKLSIGDTAPIEGIFENGLFGTNYDTSHGGTVCTHGLCPGIFDSAANPVAGDWVVPSGTVAGELHDTGISSATGYVSSGWVVGKVADPIDGDLLVAPSTPNVSGVTTTAGNPSTVTDTYCFAAVPYTFSLTTSACSSIVTVTNAPQSLNGSGNVTFSNLPTANNLAVYRLSIGHTSTLACTSNFGADGTLTSVTCTGSSAGFTSSLPPAVAFTGGGCSTEPVGKAIFINGAYAAIATTGPGLQRGIGCSGTGTVTLTANSQEVGFIGYTTATASFIDHGQPATISTAAPGAAVNGPRVIVKPELYYGPFASSSSAANMVPDTGFKQANGGYWTIPAGVAITANGDTNPNSAANGIVYTGTGSPSGILFASAGPVNIVSGQSYSFSSWVDTTNITAGSVLIRLCNTATCGGTQYAAIGPITAATAKTQSVTFTASATVSAFYVAEFNLTATNATPISVAEPMVARSSNFLSYIPNDGPGQGDPASGIKSAIAPQFSALAAGTGHVCIHADTAGNLSPTTGSDCGSGGGSGQAGQFTSVTFSGTPTFTASSNTVNAWAITLTGNVTSSTLASAAAGQYLTFNLCQDATGSRTFAWPTGFSAATAIFPTASTCTQQTFSWNGSTATPLGPANVTGSGLSALWYGPTGTAPGTPPSGFLATWFDSTDNALKTKNSSGTVASAIVPGSCTSQVLTAISDNAAATCTTLTLASAYFANQGTTTTVLHGNAAGNLSFGSVALAADVSGLLPHANIAATAVTPGSYTSANITVAADGSVTAASNGSGGGGSSTTLVSLTSTTASANSTTAQQLQEVAVTAGFFNTANGTFGLDTAGYFTTPTGQTPTVTIAHKLCTVSGCGSGTAITLDSYTSGAASVSSTDAPWRSTTTLGTSIAGANGQLEVHGNLSIGLGTTAAVAASTYGDGNTALASAINLSSSLFLDTFVTFSTNGATSNTAVQKTTRLTAGTPPASISATVSPSTASVNTLATQAFTATMSNDFSGQGVTWALSGAGCSGATCGTLSSVTTTSVTYTGPSSVPSPATVTLTATSIADTTKTSTATITVTSSGGSGATIVQPTSGNPLLPGCANNSTTNTCALPLSVTSGNTLFVMIAAGATGTVGVPVKSAGTATIGTCTAVGSGSTAGGEQQWYTCAITGSGSLTISETFSTSTNVGVFPFEVNNSAGADTVTCTVGAGSGGACYHSSNPFSTAYVTTALTPTTAGDLILLARMGGTSQTFSALTPYTLSGQGPGTTGNNTSWFTGNFTNSGTSNVAGAYTTTPGSDTEQDGGLAVK